MKKLKLNTLERENFLINFLALPLLSLFLIYSSYVSFGNHAYAVKEIKQGDEVSDRTFDVLSTNDLDVSETNRYYEELIKFRKDKLAKVQEWSSTERVKDLIDYKNFYDGLISLKDVNDFETISTELSGIADEAGIQILAITAGNAQPSREIEIEGEDVIFYEKLFSLKIEDTDSPGTGITSYAKLKNFLELLRTDIKTPYNTNIEISKGKKIGEEVNFSKISLKFFYKGEK